MNNYVIQLGGRVEIDELNVASPHQMRLVKIDAAGTWFAISTDQAGLIGVLQYVHNLGCDVAAVVRQVEGAARRINSQLQEHEVPLRGLEEKLRD